MGLSGKKKNPTGRTWLFAMVALTVGLLIMSCRSRSTLPDLVGWKSDYGVAARQAATLGKPVLIEFVTRGCPACTQLEQDVFSRQHVAKAIRTDSSPFVSICPTNLKSQVCWRIVTRSLRSRQWWLLNPKDQNLAARWVMWHQTK